MKIVLVAPPTATGGRNINDYIAAHDDSVELGPAYDAFTIANIATMLPSEFKSLIDSLMPDMQRVFRSQAPAGQWALDSIAQMQEKQAWNDSGTWRFLEKNPASYFSLNFTAQNLTDLANSGVSLAAKQSIIAGAFAHNLGLPENLVAINA